MNTLDLAWETYEFYTNEVHKYEQPHLNALKTFKNFLSLNPYPKQYQVKRIAKKTEESYLKLSLLYQKQINSLSDLINIYSNIIDIPPERDIDIEYLLTLKNVTSTLLNEILIYKKEIEKAIENC